MSNHSGRPKYKAQRYPKGYAFWNPGGVNTSKDPCKKVPTGYLPPDQTKSGKKK
jgi:hypothetical protein